MFNSKKSLLFLPWRVRMLLYKIDEWLIYRKNVFLNKPHFDGYLFACMQNKESLDIMSRLFEFEISKAKQNFKVLEVGSWGGNSAILWASICKKYQKGKVYCVDTWMGPENIPEQKKVAKKDRIMKLFLYNVETSGVKDYIVPIRTSSDEAAMILRDNVFDFIYIDGDHAYSQVIKDLANYSRIVKEGGILCGDDLQIMTTNETFHELSEKHKEENYIKDPITRINFCPGVYLGIKEFFGKDGVSMKEGFWAVRKSKEGWNKIEF